MFRNTKILTVYCAALAIFLSFSIKPSYAARTGVQEKEASQELLDAAKKPKLPEGAKLLKPMFLDKSLFIPAKNWKYEEADDDRPFAHSVDQTGSVAFGAPIEEKHGAFVQYKVTAFKSTAEAHQVYQRLSQVKKVVANITQKSRSLHKGNESIEITRVINDLKGTPQEYSNDSYIRYDKYLVHIESRSDMRSLGPRPASGSRKWMSEPVFEKVYTAAMDKWAKYKILLAESK